VVEAALAADTGIQILAVTVLTSFGAEQASELQYQGTVDDLVLQRAETVLRLGGHGVVCSAREAPLLRSRLGNDFTMVTPGIRPAGADPGDQQRVATPGRAIADGADYLVIGRPIRDAADPDACISAIQREIAAALA
jgi:orotidine-5'-phosphate decarboxylase